MKAPRFHFSSRIACGRSRRTDPDRASVLSAHPAGGEASATGRIGALDYPNSEKEDGEEKGKEGTRRP